MIVTLIVPKIIGVESYGYFQLYMMYITFLGIFHFGWVDGIYLRIGGKKYADLNSSRFSAEFICFEILEVIIGIIFIILALNFEPNVDKTFVIISAALCLIIYNTDIFIQFILLATSEIKSYSIFIIMDRIVYLFLLGIVFLSGITSYKQIIIVDLIARFIVLCCFLHKNRKLLFNFKGFSKSIFKEIITDINSGYKVTLGGVAGVLITVIARSFIENRWGIKIFGQVSLAFTLSNLLMVFVNAVSLVMFPLLRRTKNEKLAGIYGDVRTVLMVVLLGCLVLYSPLSYIVGLWLPKYTISLKFLAIMFPIVIFNSKTSMLITTYMKSLRLEKYILYSNLIAVVFSVIATSISVYIFHDLMITIIAIVVGIAIRSVYSERILSKHLLIDVNKDIVLEIILSIIFMYTSWSLSAIAGTLIYLAFYIIYLFIKKKDIQIVIKHLESNI
jgi:O-antigen/teichoic acid export membrane protein